MNLYYRIKFAIIDFWYDLCRRCQCFMRGYSWSDVWNMDCWFKRTVKPMLIHLRDNGIGVPNELYLQGAENEREAWENVLTEMIECIDMMDEDNVRESLGFTEWDYMRRMTYIDWKRVSDTMDASKNRFFELFSKYFFSLWD